MKSLKFRVLYETEILDKEQYNVYEYQGVKVFVLEGLKINGDIRVYQRLKLPFMAPAFGIAGIKVDGGNM